MVIILQNKNVVVFYNDGTGGVGRKDGFCSTYNPGEGVLIKSDFNNVKKHIYIPERRLVRIEFDIEGE